MPLKDNEKITCTVFPVSAFSYDKAEDVYFCPNGNKLKYASINKHYRKKIYSISQKICKNCLLKSKLHKRYTKMQIPAYSLFSAWSRYTARQRQLRHDQIVQRRRRIYCEGNFALQKDNYNLRRTRKRGNRNVTEHCLLSALALNLKRLVRYLRNNLITFCFNCSFAFFLTKNVAA